ncbi:MAG: hypothetical protein GY938_07385, partial [Ketobacter sp.]|nr:hypothetical protein [Ketobacter sp.]
FEKPAHVKKDAPIAAEFRLQLHCYCKHSFVGVHQYGLHQALLCIEGDIKICGVRYGKLEGGLQEQQLAFSKMVSKELEDFCDFSFTATQSDVIVLPSSCLYAMYVENGVALCWAFSSSGDSQETVFILKEIFRAYPVYMQGLWKEWYDELIETGG